MVQRRREKGKARGEHDGKRLQIKRGKELCNNGEKRKRMREGKMRLRADKEEEDKHLIQENKKQGNNWRVKT